MTGVIRHIVGQFGLPYLAKYRINSGNTSRFRPAIKRKEVSAMYRDLRILMISPTSRERVDSSKTRLRWNQIQKLMDIIYKNGTRNLAKIM